MGSFAEQAYSPIFDIHVTIRNGQQIQEYDITPENAIVLNIYEVKIKAQVILETRQSIDTIVILFFW